MKMFSRRAVLAAVALVAAFAQTHCGRVRGSASGTPLMLENQEGERRIRRPRGGPAPSSPDFLIKVGPSVNGSRQMEVASEELAPGATLPAREHFGMDALVLIEAGTAHVRLGRDERDLHAGGMVFVPPKTWLSVTNNGTETVRLTFVFTDPAFDSYLRCTSVAAGVTAGEKVRPMTEAEWRACQRSGQILLAEPGASPQK